MTPHNDASGNTQNISVKDTHIRNGHLDLEDVTDDVTISVQPIVRSQGHAIR